MRKWTMLALVVLLLALLAGCVNETDTTTTQTPTTTTPTTAPTTAPEPPPSVKNTCTVTFNNYDGTVVYTTEVEKGASVDMTQVPAAEHAYKNWYTFTGWDKTAENITEDTVITAQYDYNAIPDEAFEFVLLEDDTYGIRLADPDKDYSYLNLEGYVGFPEEYNGKPVTRILKEGMKTNYLESLLAKTTDILIPASYKVIENRAFFIALNRVTIAEGVEEIWTQAFVSVLKGDWQDPTPVTISLPSTLNYIEPAAFNGGYAIEMKNGDVYTYHELRKEILTDGGSTLVWKSTKNVVNMTIDRSITKLYPGLFSGEYDLQTVTFEGEIKELPAGTFSSCGSLMSVTFQYGLEKIWGPEQLPEIQKTLHSGDDLSGLDMGNFARCYALSFTIPETVTHIGDFTFMECPGVTGNPIVISKNVTYIGINAFAESYESYCPSITVDPANPKYYSVNDSCLIERGTGINGGDTFMVYASTHPQTEFAIPNGVTSIHPYAFIGAYTLKSLTVPEGVETLPAVFLTSTTYLFDDEWNYLGIGGLEKLSLPSTLKKIEAGMPETWGGVSMYGQFPCIEARALKELVFPNGNNVESIAYSAMFFGADINSFTFSKNATALENYCVYGENIQFFVEEGNEKYISINGSVYEKLGDNKLKLLMAARHSSITVLDLTDLGGYILTEIGENACNNNMYLTQIILPESLEKIGNYGLATCTMLTEIVLPANLKEIGDGAFYGCTALQKVTFLGETVPTVGGYAFYANVEVWNEEFGFPEYLDRLIPGITFCVPEGSYDAYYEAFATIDPAMAEAIVK